MTQWWRFYSDAIFDPKLLRLSDAMFRAWTTLLCLAAKNDGVLPTAQDIALTLRMKPAKVAEWITTLVAAGLIDRTEAGFEPHNWSGRQYKSDVSTDRVKRFRNAQRNAAPTVSETPPETETETEKNSEPNGSGAAAPDDPRSRLFSEGLPAIERMSGRGANASRSFIGKCLKAADDDAVTVLGLIEEADRNRVIDPCAWIVARLKPQGPTNGRRTIHQASSDLLENLRRLNEPAPGSLRSGEGEGVVRLLPSR
jgi:hypothetical protein